MENGVSAAQAMAQKNNGAPGASGGNVNPELYPVAVLIDELRAEEQKKRVAAVAELNTIAVALGPERTRNELLPYILELLDDEEEVLFTLAETLGTMLPAVGGPAHAEHIFKTLEKLSQIEESTVREKVSKILA